MIQKGLYKVGDSPQKKGEKSGGRRMIDRNGNGSGSGEVFPYPDPTRELRRARTQPIY